MVIEILTVDDIEEFNKLFRRLQEITPKLEKIASDYDNYYLLIKQYAEEFAKYEERWNEKISGIVFQFSKDNEKIIRLLDKRMKEKDIEKE